jgi:hypothetical protein
MFKVNKEKFFEVAEAERENVKVHFKHYLVLFF